MIRNHRLERVKYLLGVTHTFQSNKTPRVEIRGGLHVFFLYNLDSCYRGSMSNQQRRQSVNRRVGPPSTRGHNEVPESLLWAIKS